MIKGKKKSSIKEFEDYEICETGTVYSLLQQTLKPHDLGELSIRTDRAGYTSVRISKLGQVHTRFIHRLLAQCFIPNPKNLPEVNHMDGNRLNNSLPNLEWTSHQGNVQHAFDNCLNTSAKMILDTATGVVYNSIKEAARAIKMNYNTCCKRLQKQSPGFRLRYLG